jgi:cellulose synthase operon protein C
LPDKQFRAVHAIFLLREHKNEQGLSELESLAKREPDDRDLRNLLVSAYVAQGRNTAANDVLQAAIKRNPKDADALQQRADLYLRTGKYSEAEQDIYVVLHSLPDSARAHYSMARILGARGAELRQVQELSETLRLKPDMLSARVELSKLVLRGNGAQEALALLDKAPAPQQKTVEYLAARNRILLAMNRTPEVRKNLDSALAAAQSPELLYQDGLLRVIQKDFAGARRSLETVLKSEPDNTSAAQLLAVSYLSEHNVDKALGALQECSSQRPKSAPMRTLLGIWLARAGRRGEARTALGEAMNMNP